MNADELRARCKGLFDQDVIEWYLRLTTDQRVYLDALISRGDRPGEIIGDFVEEAGGNRVWWRQLGAPLVCGGYLGGSREAEAWRSGQ